MVTDNENNYNRQLDKAPGVNSTKLEIENYMTANDTCFEECYTKKGLRFFTDI